MSFGCNNHELPSLSSFDDAQRHWNRVKPYRGASNDAPRPIGARAHGNKQMRVLDDGSIAFRFYRTDCVIWHTNNEVTIKGYASMSTTGFVNGLVADGVSHGQGRNDTREPILYLRPQTRRDLDDWRSHWNSALVVRCDNPVRLGRNSSHDGWWPVNEAELVPFHVPTIDRGAARAASAKYNLVTFEQVLSAMIGLGDIPPSLIHTREHTAMAAVMEHLLDGDYYSAASHVPRGGGSKAFGRKEVGPKEIRPGFLRRLRDAIYEEEDVLVIANERVLTMSAYRRYVTMSRRF